MSEPVSKENPAQEVWDQKTPENLPINTFWDPRNPFWKWLEKVTMLGAVGFFL
jgi:hypothetical protein